MIFNPRLYTNYLKYFKPIKIILFLQRWDPCGMLHIEGACCGLLVLFLNEGGGINESCKNYEQENKIKELNQEN